jgi:hypothetical protein
MIFKTNSMSKIVFMWWLLNGTITPAGEHEDHKLYTVWFSDGKVADYAYKGEVMNYIKTGKFEYDESLEFGHEIDEEVFYSKN